MKEEPLLTIRFDGEAIGPGKIPAAHLLRFLENFSKALHRTGHVLTSEATSIQRGPQSNSIKAEQLDRINAYICSNPKPMQPS